MQRSVLTALAAAAVIHCAAPAHAAVTPEQARALETQFKAWMAGLLGPNVRLGDRPVQFTPDGEAYRVAVPIPVTRDNKPEILTMSAQARPIDGGRWAISAFRLPLPARFTVMVPQPAKDGQKTPGPSLPVNYVITAAAQDGSATWDPSYATPSVFTSTLTNLRSETSGAGLMQTTTVARGVSNTTIRPATGDRVDFVGDSMTEGYSVMSKAGDTDEVKVSVARARTSSTVLGMSRDRATQMIQALAQLVSTSMAPAPATAGSPPPVNLVALRTLLQAMDGLASDFTVEQTLNDVSFSYGGMGGVASQVSLGMAAKAPNGMLQAQMDMGMDGLSLPGLPLGPLADFVPRRVALRPVVSGIATKDLFDLARASTDAKDGNPPPEAVSKLFSRGGITTGLESFTIDLAGTVFAGNAKVLVPAPNQVSGSGQLTATNFDAFIAKGNTIPQMAQVMPAFLYAKGLARTVDNKLVWDVSYQGNKLMVNGTDLSAMMAGGRK